jgi:predicted membrane protein
MAKYSRSKNDSGIIFGFIILAIGVLLLLRKLGFFFPDWLLSWPMILIAIGAFTLIKHEFKSFFGAIMLTLGVYFLFEREFDFDFGIQIYLFPIILIVLGLYLITQKNRENKVLDDIQKQMRSGLKSESSSFSGQPSSESTGSAYSQTEKSTSNFGTSGSTFSDRLNIDAVFSGVNKRVMSKNFSGGKLTAAFGGVDLDLTQADFNGMATLQVDVIFGGMKLIVHPHWDVRVEVSNIAAGVEDKRLSRITEVDPEKVLLIKGTVFFGGLEIKSY